ncbi:MAG: hypothetical protein OXC00_01060 [Acidimicrobiaceae bacterium]|nr:hypothetical protein [Acidimicrobiaceae bacterium]
MTKTEHLQAEVTVAGALSCIDNDGARALTSDEFHDIIGRIADHLDDESRITDPSVWGQASSGDMEMYFRLPDPAGLPTLNVQIADIIRQMGEAVGLVWANDPSPPSRVDVATMLAQKSQRCDLVPVAV